MTYKLSSIDIIGAVVAAMEFPVTIKSAVESPPGTWTLEVCDIYHTQIGFNVEIDGNLYEITDFSFESSTIAVQGDAPIVVTSFELYHPHFYHGTLAATNVELNQEQSANNKTPMIWMREFPMKDKFNTGITPIERELSGSELYFLSQTDQEEYQTEQSYQYVIMPMRRLQENFLLKMEEMASVFNLEDWDYEVENYAKLAVYASGKSSKKAFFVDKLAGCAMPMTGLQIWKDGLCDLRC